MTVYAEAAYDVKIQGRVGRGLLHFYYFYYYKDLQLSLCRLFIHVFLVAENLIINLCHRKIIRANIFFIILATTNTLNYIFLLYQLLVDWTKIDSTCTFPFFSLLSSLLLSSPLWWAYFFFPPLPIDELLTSSLFFDKRVFSLLFSPLRSVYLDLSKAQIGKISDILTELSPNTNWNSNNQKESLHSRFSGFSSWFLRLRKSRGK